MRRFLTLVLAFSVSLGGVALLADKAKTPEDLDKAMKRISTAQTATNKARSEGVQRLYLVRRMTPSR